MRYNIAVFPGDGVGPELINEGTKVVEKAAELDKFEVEWVKFPHGAEHYLETKELLDEKTLKGIRSSCSAIYCGTFDLVNNEKISSLIRDYCGQFVSLRPIKLLPSVESPLASKSNSDIDITLIRESTEDFYLGAGGRVKNGKNRHQFELDTGNVKAKFGINAEAKGSEIAYQMGVISRKGCERIAKYAFEYAKGNNKKKIVAVDKANVLDFHSLWRESFEKISKEYNGIQHEFSLIDAAVMNFIRQPEKYEIVVAPNMFGDILSDLGTVLQGGLSFAAHASINPEGISMFEPIHGCAPKLKDKGIVSPVATVWAAALMLQNIGQHKSGDLMIKAVEGVLKDGRTRTQELGGNNSTAEMGGAITDKLIEIHD